MNSAVSSSEYSARQTDPWYVTVVATCDVAGSWQDALEQSLYDHDLGGRKALHEFWQMRVVQYAFLLSQRAVELEQACQKKNLVSQQCANRGCRTACSLRWLYLAVPSLVGCVC